MSRARAMHTVVHLLEARGLFTLQKATARAPVAGTLVLRAGKAPERAIAVAPDAYLFRAFGEALFQSRGLHIVGGEPVAYHTDARGAIDYLELYAPPKGASAERVSPYTIWTTTLSSAKWQADSPDARAASDLSLTCVSPRAESRVAR